MKIQTLFRISLVSIVLATSWSVTPVFAQQSSSSSYQVNEVFFGTGGELNACSGSYCSKQSAGELTVGNTKGNQFQAQAGFNTDRTPWLEVDVTKAAVDLGVISPTSTGSDYASFSVKSYLAQGYVVQITGPAPTNASHEVTRLATPTAVNPGTEQFGLNLRDNTTPNIGAEPVQRPDATFSFGTYAAGYNTADQFKYAPDDVIAQSTKSSGYTDYTITYIMNVSAVTPGGTYTTDQSLVVTSTF
jgi:hypothetical protein